MISTNTLHSTHHHKQLFGIICRDFFHVCVVHCRAGRNHFASDDELVKFLFR